MRRSFVFFGITFVTTVVGSIGCNGGNSGFYTIPQANLAVKSQAPGPDSNSTAGQKEILTSDDVDLDGTRFDSTVEIYLGGDGTKILKSGRDRYILLTKKNATKLFDNLTGPDVKPRTERNEKTYINRYFEFGENFVGRCTRTPNSFMGKEWTSDVCLLKFSFHKFESQPKILETVTSWNGVGRIYKKAGLTEADPGILKNWEEGERLPTAQVSRQFKYAFNNNITLECFETQRPSGGTELDCQLNSYDNARELFNEL